MPMPDWNEADLRRMQQQVPPDPMAARAAKLAEVLDQLATFTETMIGTRRALLAGGWSAEGAEALLVAIIAKSVAEA